MLDFQAEDSIIRTRDIQLLRLTKQMQEYLRSGDEYSHGAEIAALEKRSEYSEKAHRHKLDEKTRNLNKISRKVSEKTSQNSKLDQQLSELAKAVSARQEIHDSSSRKSRNKNADSQEEGGDTALLEIYNRRRLVDLAKAQAQDISILREEVERLRLRTYPAFSTAPKRF